MTLIADILLIAGAIGAAFYCLVLSRRLSRFSDLEGGVGGAVAGLSQQVADLTRALDRAHTEARDASEQLAASTKRADEATRKIELMLASMHDLPEPRKAETADRGQPDMPQRGSAPPTFRRRMTMSPRQEAAE